MRSLIEEILVPNSKRLDKLIEILENNEISYKTEKYNGAVNLIVPIKGSNKATDGFILLGAHYDIYPGSYGINDNSCALGVLIEFILATKLRKPKENLEIVFFDKEEVGMIGSYNYALKHNKEINAAIILDIIGYGDTYIYGTPSHSLSFKDLLERVGAKEIATVLPSDNVQLSRFVEKVALITAVHDKDIIRTRSSYWTHDLGPSPEFYTSFHNRKNDNDINIINFELLETLKYNLANAFLEDRSL
jgi:hypothetical protein